jgi:citrate synthase
MNVFWRKEPLNTLEKGVFEAVMSAHRTSAMRNNSSSVAVLNSYAGSGDCTKAIAAALMTLGGHHAPIESTVHFLMSDDIEKATDIRLSNGVPVPGWGNSFIKGRKDDLWLEVDALLSNLPIGQKIEQVTKRLHAAGKQIYPNPSAYTAAAAIILKCPPQFAAWFFIQGRLSPWFSRMFAMTEGGA